MSSAPEKAISPAVALSPILPRRAGTQATGNAEGASTMNVLVAGGAGYIGSHTAKRLKEAGHSPVIYDNLSRGHRSVVDILKVPAVAADLNDRETLTATLREHKIDAVMHFAAFAFVGESVEKPL